MRGEVFFTPNSDQFFLLARRKRGEEVREKGESIIQGHLNQFRMDKKGIIKWERRANITLLSHR
jgi:hypothetical protein